MVVVALGGIVVVAAVASRVRVLDGTAVVVVVALGGIVVVAAVASRVRALDGTAVVVVVALGGIVVVAAVASRVRVFDRTAVVAVGGIVVVAAVAAACEAVVACNNELLDYLLVLFQVVGCTRVFSPLRDEVLDVCSFRVVVFRPGPFYFYNMDCWLGPDIRMDWHTSWCMRRIQLEDMRD